MRSVAHQHGEAKVGLNRTGYILHAPSDGVCVTQDLRLDREQLGLNSGSAAVATTGPPAEVRALALDRGAGVMVSERSPTCKRSRQSVSTSPSRSSRSTALM